MKSALLILDTQNDFFETDNPNLAEFKTTIPVINSAISFFRDQQWPIIFIQHTSKKKPANSHSWEIYPEINCQPDDIQISKTHLNAFWNSQLDASLKSHQVDFVAIAGYLAEHCVLSSVRGAIERGYDATIIEGAIASLNNQYTQFTLEITSHLSLAELKESLLSKSK